MQNLRHWICIQTNKGEEEKIDDDENGLLYADGAGSCAGRAWKAVSLGGRTGREERKTGRTGRTAEYG